MQRRYARVWTVGRWLSLAVSAQLAGVLLAPVAHAQNPVFQSFFFAVCGGSPTGALATRCGETPGGTGNISGDSEDSLNPSQFLAVNQAALARARLTSKQVQERLEKTREQPDEASGSIARRWNIFAHTNFENIERDQTDLQRGFDSDRLGLEFGFDVRLSDGGLVGALLTYEETDTDFDPDQPGVNFDPPDNDGETDADGVSVTLFASRDLGKKMWLDGSIGYGQTNHEFTRNSVFQESTRTVSQTNVGAVGDADGDEFFAGAGFGYDYGPRAFGGSVYGRLNYIRSEVDGFAESDPSGLAMLVGDETRRSFLGTLGWRGSYVFSTSWGVFIPHVRIEYEHDFEDDAASAAASYVLDSGRNLFGLAGDDPDSDYFNGAAGFVVVMPKGWNVFLDLEIQTGHSRLDRQRVTAGFRKEL